MKEQYLVMYQNKFMEKEERWINAVWLHSGCKKRYAETIEEAEMYLQMAIDDGVRKATKIQYQHVANGIGITTEQNEDMLVTNTKIRKRYVTEWEDV